MAKFRENIHLGDLKKIFVRLENPHNIIKYFFSFKFLNGQTLYCKWKLNPEM